jgi:hypothetical protein|nr:MAG: hypothetical protein [Bacteriophage sp.]
MGRKIEVDEDDLKKIILLLKLSKQYVQSPHENLTLCNLWRVSGKLADKLMKKAKLVMVTNKGRTTLKPIGEVKSEEVSEASHDKHAEKVPRCRKRKS